MSRSPLRDLFQLVHSGLEKVVLACAAFGLMHATARAGESAPAGVPAGEQWSGHVAPQPTADDPWSNPSAPTPAIDDAWSAPAADRFISPGQSRAASSVSPPSASAQVPRPAVTKSRPGPVATTGQETPRALAMDRSDWNETPRGRSPGLIASHDAWLKRSTPVAEPSAPAKAPVYSAPPPAADPWSARWIGLVASNDVSTPAPTLSSPAFDAGSRPGIVVSPHARLPHVGEARGALLAEASPTVLATGRPMDRRSRPILHSTANAPRSSGMKRARAIKSAKAPSRAWCRSVSASARYR